MDLWLITDQQKSQYNSLVTHVIQSWEWGEFRKNLEIPVLRFGLYDDDRLEKAFQLTLHKIPFTNQFVGYLPKGPAPDKDLAEALEKIGKEHHCAFIKLEPNVILGSEANPESDSGFIPRIHPEGQVLRSRCPQDRGARMTSGIAKDFILSPKPLFTKYNFILDLTKSEEIMLKNMHPKTRYNIKVAQRHRVKVEERVDDQALEIYLKLYFETTKRQGYFGHNEEYHRRLWKLFRNSDMARLLIAFYHEPRTTPEPLAAWMLLNFQDTLYYPYGGSSKNYPQVMANNLVAWEAIRLGKKMGLKKFDLWGALGPDADPKDPWFGFHKFKQGYGGTLVEYLGTFDLVLNYPIYWIFTFIDKMMPLKVFLLKMIRK